MSSGMWGAILFLITAGLLLYMVWRMSAPEHEKEEDDIRYTHHPHGWVYQFEDPIQGPITWGGYRTKYHAKRAARIERDRIAEGRHRGANQ